MYKTSDLYEAALLYAKRSGDFSGITKTGNKCFFSFKETECRDLADQYYAREAFVNAKDYSDAIRTCKDLIFQQMSRLKP